MKKYLSNTLAISLVICTLTGCVGKIDKVNTGTIASMPVSYSLENDMPDSSFNREEYQKLLALQFDGYEDMTISDYQNRIWNLTDTKEYRDLLERFSKSKTLYELKDSNETAAFLFYVLEPLTAEKWKSRDYSGYVTSAFSYPAENATLEYTCTFTILNADTLIIREYSATRLGVINGMHNILSDKTKEELQNVNSMTTTIKTSIDNLIKQLQTEKIGISIEYAFFPLSSQNSNNENKYLEDNGEQRMYSNGTKEDYCSLLALKTQNYQNMSIADFNAELLKWANEDYERMERINCDITYNDFFVPLSASERRFVLLSVNFSGIENAKYVQSNYTGMAEEAPSYYQYLPQKTDSKNGYSTWCDLYYQFSYQIADKETLTVGERDHCIGGMMAAIKEFWDRSDIDSLLKMKKAKVVKRLKRIAGSYSTEQIAVKISKDNVFFESMDERNIECAEQNTSLKQNNSAAYAKLMTYKTKNYSQQSIADFRNTLQNGDYSEFSEVYETVITDILPDDENYDFIMLTLSSSVSELYFKNVEKSDKFSMYYVVKKQTQPVKPLPGEEYILAKEPIYDFNFYGDYRIQYIVPNPSILTIEERDNALRTIYTEMQKYVDGLSEAEIMSDNIKTLLTDKAAEIANNVSSDNIKLSCEIYGIEINNGGENSVWFAKN